MKGIKSAVLAVMATSVVWSGGAAAQSSYKCNSRNIIQVGESISQVRARCGSPEFKDDQTGQGSENRVEVWTYNDYNKRGWMTELRFFNGTLTEVRSLGKVRR